MLIKADISINEILEDLEMICKLLLRVCKDVAITMKNSYIQLMATILKVSPKELVTIISNFETGKNNLKIIIIFWGALLAIAIIIIIFIIITIKKIKKKTIARTSLHKIKKDSPRRGCPALTERS